MRVIGDYLGLVSPKVQSPIEDADALNHLFDLWRTDDLEMLGAACHAACEYPALNGGVMCFGGNARLLRKGQNVPLAVLLVFKLRQLSGLRNPIFEHPLMSEPCSVFLSGLSLEMPFEPTGLIGQVRARMVENGYDEQAIFKECLDFALGPVPPRLPTDVERKTRRVQAQPDVEGDVQNLNNEREQALLRFRKMRLRGVASRQNYERRRQMVWPALRQVMQARRDADLPTVLEHLSRFVNSPNAPQPLASNDVGNFPWRKGLIIDLARYVDLSLASMQRQVMDQEPFGSAASSTFAAAYLAESLRLHWHIEAWYKQKLSLSSFYFTALGVVFGNQEDAFRLAHMQLEALRRPLFGNGNFVDENGFIACLLADYLGKGPLYLLDVPESEVCHFVRLFDNWRNVPPESIADLCMTLCDDKTDIEGIANYGIERDESGEPYNFSERAIPVTILLLFKLRKLIGLENPSIDHPWLTSPSRFPPGDEADAPDDLLVRVRAKMQILGFDESGLVAEYCPYLLA